MSYLLSPQSLKLTIVNLTTHFNIYAKTKKVKIEKFYFDFR